MKPGFFFLPAKDVFYYSKKNILHKAFAYLLVDDSTKAHTPPLLDVDPNEEVSNGSPPPPNLLESVPSLPPKFDPKEEVSNGSPLPPNLLESVSPFSPEFDPPEHGSLDLLEFVPPPLEFATESEEEAEEVDPLEFVTVELGEAPQTAAVLPSRKRKRHLSLPAKSSCGDSSTEAAPPPSKFRKTTSGEQLKKDVEYLLKIQVEYLKICVFLKKFLPALAKNSGGAAVSFFELEREGF